MRVTRLTVGALLLGRDNEIMRAESWSLLTGQGLTLKLKTISTVLLYTCSIMYNLPSLKTGDCNIVIVTPNILNLVVSNPLATKVRFGKRFLFNIWQGPLRPSSFCFPEVRTVTGCDRPELAPGLARVGVDAPQLYRLESLLSGMERYLGLELDI